jgi:hypothetical protein
MAGLVARYSLDRCRAVVAFHGFIPWAFALGQILQVIQQGDDVASVGSVITSVEYIVNGKDPKTIIKTGYA